MVLYGYYPNVLYHFHLNYVETGPGPARLEVRPRTPLQMVNLAIVDYQRL